MMSRHRSPFLLTTALLTSLLLLFASFAAAESTAAPGDNPPDGSLYLEMTLADGAVTGVTLYDAAGKLLLAQTGPGDAGPEEALRAMISQIVGAGYLAASENEPYLFVTVTGDGPGGALAASLRTAAGETLRALGSAYRVGGAALDAEDSERAALLGVSGGRYRMMAYIAQQQGIAVEEAVRMYGDESVQALMRTFVGLREAMGDEGDADANNGNGKGYGEGLETEEQTRTQLETQDRDQTQDQLETQDCDQTRDQTTDKQQTNRESNGNGQGNGKK